MRSGFFSRWYARRQYDAYERAPVNSRISSSTRRVSASFARTSSTTSWSRAGSCRQSAQNGDSEVSSGALQTQHTSVLGARRRQQGDRAVEHGEHLLVRVGVVELSEKFAPGLSD